MLRGLVKIERQFRCFISYDSCLRHTAEADLSQAELLRLTKCIHYGKKPNRKDYYIIRFFLENSKIDTLAMFS